MPAIPAPQQQAIFCTSKDYKVGCVITSYYTFGGQRVAMRSWNGADATGVVTWLHGDMLGSASVTTDASGNKTSELRYKPYGEVRYSWGAVPTDRQFTGQLSVGMGVIDFGQGTRLTSYIERTVCRSKHINCIVDRRITCYN